MSYKYFGRLIGKIASGDTSLSLTTPADTTTPFNPQSPGTKFMAYGEDATSTAFNRAFSALATNIESVAGILGSPALRSEMLAPSDASSTGFSTLVADAGQSSVQLADTPGSATQPPVWVYTGFTARDLAQSTKLFSVSGEVAGSPSHEADAENGQAVFTNFYMSPTDCRENAGALATEYAGQVFSGNDDRTLPYTIPPVRKIQSDISPYNGTFETVNIHSWEPDGLYVKTTLLDQLALRSGCFVEIQNNGNPSALQGNNGLFRIENITPNKDFGGASIGSKVVLSRGNLHRVTVSSGDLFEAGQLVSWASSPNHADDTLATPRVRTHFAHVMYKVPRHDISPDAADLYINNASGPDHFTYGTGSSRKYDASLADNIPTVETYGSVGLADQESDAEQNWLLPTGAYIYNSTATSDPADAGAGYAEVLAVIPAGYPVVFSTQNTPGQFVPCTPPGFLLNPILEFPSELVPGNNYLWAKTLTTVGEQLTSQTGGYLPLSAEDQSSEPYQTRQDVIATENFLSHAHHGNMPAAGTGVVNGPKSPTKDILGPNLWKLNVTSAAMNSFSDSFIAAGNVFGEDFVQFLNPAGSVKSWARVINASQRPDGTNDLILSDVLCFSGYDKGPFLTPIDFNWTTSFGATVFTVQSIAEGPKLTDTGGVLLPGKGDPNGNEFVPSHGLNAAFHMQNSSCEMFRGVGSALGNIIYVPGGTRHPSGDIEAGFNHRPFTTVLEGIAANEVGHLIISDSSNVGLIELESRSPAAVVKARIRYDEGQGDGSLTLGDVNTLSRTPLPDHGGDIPLSSNSVSEVVDRSMHDHRDIPSEVAEHTSNHRSILNALESLLLGNKDVEDDFVGEHTFGAFSNGVFHGAEVYSIFTYDSAIKNLPSTNDVGVWTAPASTINVTEAYFNEGGAKNYQGSTVIDLSAHDPDSDVVLFWDTKNREYSTHESPGGNLTVMNCEIPIDLTYMIPIAVIGLSGGDAVSVTDIRQRISNVNQRDEIYVGRFTQKYLTDPMTTSPHEIGIFSQGGMNFTTLGEAFSAVNAWNRYLTSGRRWTIKVVGPTQEYPDLHRGITYPLKAHVDSITVEGGGPWNGSQAHTDGVKPVVVTVHGANSLFDLHSKSNLTFKNLAVHFDPSIDSWDSDVANIEGNSTVNVFVNTRDQHYTNNENSYGPSAEFGRKEGGGYDPSTTSDAFQADIHIENVHAYGSFHSFFFAGALTDVAPGNVPVDGDDTPFDNLTIHNCSANGSYHSFVNIGPSNSLHTTNSDLGDVNGHTLASPDKPYYWRNINITGCRAVARAFDASLPGTYLPSLTLHGIHLAACKGVVVRDNWISRYTGGITFGPGNWSHACSGSIENNTIYKVSGDGITAISHAYYSGIRIVGNFINHFGLLWETPAGLTFETRHNIDPAYTTSAEGRYAGIRAAAHDIIIDSNTIVDSRSSTLSAYDSTRAHTVAIHLSRDSDFEADGYLYGNRVTNNTFSSYHKGMRFLYAGSLGLAHAVCSGNSATYEGEGRDFPLGYLTHPAHHGVADMSGYADTLHDDSSDAWAIYTNEVNDCTFSGNTLQGHVYVKHALQTSFSDNSFTYPTTVCFIQGGLDVNFSGNRLNNGSFFVSCTEASVTDNSFHMFDDDLDYPDTYSTPTTPLYPGVYITPKMHPGRFRTDFRVSGNRFGWTSTNPITSAGINPGGMYWQLAASIEILEPYGTRSAVVISDNRMQGNGQIVTDAKSRLLINNNYIETSPPYGPRYGNAISVLHLNELGEIGINDDYLTGVDPSGITITNNVVVGHIHVNGSADLFGSFSQIATAFATGTLPDGSNWGTHPDTGNSIPYLSTKLSGVNISNNAVYGNIELMSVQDSVLTGNRLAGELDTDKWDDALAAGTNPSGILDLFISGQISMANCNRVHISSSIMASAYITDSKFIRISSSTVGFRDSAFDMYNLNILSNVANYSPMNQGRVYAYDTPHLSIESCILSPSTRDARKGIGDPSTTMNYLSSVYSALGSRQSIIQYMGNEQISNVNRTDNKLIPLQVRVCPAASLKDSHVGYAIFSTCTDLMIEGNRFYQNGENPAASYALSLRVIEGSLRPQISNNHFTASVEIGDRGHFEGKTVWNGAGQPSRTIYLESPVRYPVYAQVVGNRFDSGYKQNSSIASSNDYAVVGGSGDLVIHNFGGSVVSSNHMIKGHTGYMLHAASQIDLNETRYTGMDLVEVLAHAIDRADLNNRIGGSILLDPDDSYPAEYYTKSHMYYGSISLLEDSNKQAQAYHVVQIGSGHPNNNPDWEPTMADAPKTHFIIEGPAESPPDWANDGHLDDAASSRAIRKTRNLPWGGTWVYNWWATPDDIIDGATQDFELVPGTAGSITVHAQRHFPKTLGAFVIGNFAKRVRMEERLRASSWAYGRHCDISIHPETGNPLLPAQAYETALNPMHANNHAQFNMLRYKDPSIDLAIFGNFGSYVVQSNRDLTGLYGPMLSSGTVGLTTGEYCTENEAHQFPMRQAWGRWFCTPVEPLGTWLYSKCQTDYCDPWENWNWTTNVAGSTGGGGEVRIDWPQDPPDSGWVNNEPPEPQDPPTAAYESE